MDSYLSWSTISGRRETKKFGFLTIASNSLLLFRRLLFFSFFFLDSISSFLELFYYHLGVDFTKRIY